MHSPRIPLLLALLHVTLAAQPSAPSPLPAPLRPLPWSAGKGSLNFLHTTDTHGWHAGHLQEAQYSADWGDYISFAHHLHARADDDGSDLLLIDTGDRVEGNGLYDASDPKGNYTFDIFPRQRIDVITPGNHELYLANTSRREFERVVPDFRDSYIASNLDIHDPDTGTLEPLAPRYRKFTTKNNGIRVLALGFLFNFHGNANNTVVQPVQETVKEQWFQDALREKDVDLFLVAGHVPVRDSEEYDLIYKAIRNVKWDTPIVFFGGHTHIRDYRKWEEKAWGLESGRYMETIGFLSIDGLPSHDTTHVDGGKEEAAMSVKKTPQYKRMYIDNNLYSLHHHSHTNASTFPTALGQTVSAQIYAAREALHLDHTYGCAPQTYWLSRAPYPSNASLLSLLDTHILPDTFSAALPDPAIVLTNSGALRFDVFAGPFTIDSTFLVSPFTSGFRMLRGVPYAAASQVLGILNNEGPIALEELAALGAGSGISVRVEDLTPPLPAVSLGTLERTEVGGYPAFARRTDGGGGGGGGRMGEAQVPLADGRGDDDDDDDVAPTVPGYTTTDDAGSDGDDTVHEAIQFYEVPNCVGANIHFSPTSSSASVASSDDAETADHAPPRHGDLRRRQRQRREPLSPTAGPAKPETLDLVYNEFVERWVLLALRFLGEAYGPEEAEPVLGGESLTRVIEGWVGGHWACG